MTLSSFGTPERGGWSWSECALRASQAGATVGSSFDLPDQRVARAQGTKRKAIIRHSGGSTASLRPRVGGFHPSAVVCEDHRYVLKKSLLPRSGVGERGLDHSSTSELSTSRSRRAAIVTALRGPGGCRMGRYGAPPGAPLET